MVGREKIDDVIFDEYRGFQVRIQPHVSAPVGKLPGRLIEDSTGEPHDNLSLWLRIIMGEHAFPSDEYKKLTTVGFSNKMGGELNPCPLVSMDRLESCTTSSL